MERHGRAVQRLGVVQDGIEAGYCADGAVSLTAQDEVVCFRAALRSAPQRLPRWSAALRGSL
jgi:hypothetical protein